MGDKAKLVTTALLVVLVALLLGACGGGGDDSSSATDRTTAEAGDTTAGDTSSAQDGTSAADSSKPSDGDKSDGGDSKGEDGNGDGEQSPESESEGSGGGQSGGGGGGQSQNQSGGGGQKGGGQKGGTNKTRGARPPEPANEGLKGIENFGSEASPSERDEAEAALDLYLKTYAKKDWAAVCGMLAKPVLAQLEKLAAGIESVKGTDCIAVFSTPGLPPILGPEFSVDSVSSFRIEGSVGYALYQNDKFVMLMQKEGGDWKVNGITPEPVP